MVWIVISATLFLFMLPVGIVFYLMCRSYRRY